MLKIIRKLLGLSVQPAASIHPELARILGGSSTPDTFESVTAKLTSDSIDDRRNAAYALGDYDEPTVGPTLLKLIYDPDLYVRVYSIQSPGRRRELAAVLPLCELLMQGNAEPLVCTNALRVLADLRDPRASTTLIHLLASENSFVRYDAAFALGEIGQSDAIPHLKSILGDDTMPESIDDDGGVSTSWTVGENAQKAINKIRSTEPPPKQ